MPAGAATTWRAPSWSRLPCVPCMLPGRGAGPGKMLYSPLEYSSLSGAQTSCCAVWHRWCTSPAQNAQIPPAHQRLLGDPTANRPANDTNSTFTCVPRHVVFCACGVLACTVQASTSCSSRVSTNSSGLKLTLNTKASKGLKEVTRT